MNPILASKYNIPDVEARVYLDGKIYIYGSMDRINNDYYCSNEYQVFYSRDLLRWESKGVSFSSLYLKCPTKQHLYAPDCIYKDGIYYLMYCLEDGSEGYAISTDPCGPFEDQGIIEGITGIDPSILVDDDNVYYFWGQMSLKGAKLNLQTGELDMSTFVDGILTQESDGFHEGSSIRKIGNKYYMVFADISRGRPTCLGYAISDAPLGPYEKKGIIIDNTGCDPSTWNNHGSIQEIGGKFYVFYHRATNNSEFSRRVCIEPITIDEDGLIKEVEMTSQGVEGPLPATRYLSASAFCQLSGTCYLTSFVSSEQCYEYLFNIHNGDCGIIKYIVFDETISEVTVWAANVDLPSEVVITLDKPDGEKIACVAVEKTGGNFAYQMFTSKLSQTVSGEHAVCVTFIGNKSRLMNFKGIQFHAGNKALIQ
jgi:arabinoxylan arabinofuranohydrolase